MFGRDVVAHVRVSVELRDRDLAPTPCGRLQQQWFRKTSDVVTATPAVADDTAYVGDWSGKFYAISLDRRRHSLDLHRAEPHKNVYSGQIVASAAVADVDGERRVVLRVGQDGLRARRASDGTLRWKHELNPEGDDDDLTEIQSSPLVVDGMVIVGYDGHDTPGTRAGIVALDAATGDERWNFDSDRGRPATGCGGVWSSPAVDTDARSRVRGHRELPELAHRLERVQRGDLRGRPRDRRARSGRSNRAGRATTTSTSRARRTCSKPTGEPVVGLGGKDGIYYALDRATGKLVWKTTASTPRVQAPNFSTGGFIGATAVDDGVVVGGTAIGGPCPCLHGIDADNGAIAWQQTDAGADVRAERRS